MDINEVPSPGNGASCRANGTTFFFVTIAVSWVPRVIRTCTDCQALDS